MIFQNSSQILGNKFSQMQKMVDKSVTRPDIQKLIDSYRVVLVIFAEKQMLHKGTAFRKELSTFDTAGEEDIEENIQSNIVDKLCSITVEKSLAKEDNPIVQELTL